MTSNLSKKDIRNIPELEHLRKAIAEEVSDPQKQERVLTKISAIIKSHVGPLPSPECLQEYNSVLPGLAERIVSMAEKQSNHRIKIEEIVIQSNVKESRLGQTYGLLIGLAGMAVTLTLALSGHDSVASIIGSSTLVSLVAVFVIGRRKQQKELERKG